MKLNVVQKSGCKVIYVNKASVRMINVEEIATADIAPGYTRVNVTFQLAKVKPVKEDQ